MSNSRNTYSVRVRRVASDGTTAATGGSRRSGSTATAGSAVDAMALAALTSRIARLEDMWQQDPDAPGSIYTPYNAYAMGGMSALGRSPELPDPDNPDGSGSGGGLLLMEQWSDAAPEGKALAAPLGIELRTALEQTYQRVDDTVSASNALRRRVEERLRRVPDGHLRRGLIPLEAEAGMIYTNHSRVRRRIARGATSCTVNLETYFTREQAADISARIIDGNTDKVASESLATLSRTNNTIRATIHQQLLSDSYAIIFYLPQSMNGRYIMKTAKGKITTVSNVNVRAPHLLPQPSDTEIKNIFDATGDSLPPCLLKGFQIQRRRRVQRKPVSGVFYKRRKWVTLGNKRRLLNSRIGVFRIRRRSLSGGVSLWVFVSVNKGTYKVIGT